MGDLIYNKHDDSGALGIAVLDTIRCANLQPPRLQPWLIQMAINLRREMPWIWQAIAIPESALDVLRAVVARMASMPGQRNIVMISPGFLVLEDRRDEQKRRCD